MNHWIREPLPCASTNYCTFNCTAANAYSRWHHNPINTAFIADGNIGFTVGRWIKLACRLHWYDFCEIQYATGSCWTPELLTLSIRLRIVGSIWIKLFTSVFIECYNGSRRHIRLSCNTRHCHYRSGRITIFTANQYYQWVDSFVFPGWYPALIPHYWWPPVVIHMVLDYQVVDPLNTVLIVFRRCRRQCHQTAGWPPPSDNSWQYRFCSLLPHNRHSLWSARIRMLCGTHRSMSRTNASIGLFACVLASAAEPDGFYLRWRRRWPTIWCFTTAPPRTDHP